MTIEWTGRPLERGGPEVSALGLGCWAIGGPATLDGKSIGWGEVDDAESIRAIQRALDLGETLFDTAAFYSAGHSERVVGQALAGRCSEAVISTKFGLSVDEARREMTGLMNEPDAAAVRAECQASLRRLGAEVIDLFWCHPGELSTDQAAATRDILEGLVAEGLIRGYG